MKSIPTKNIFVAYYAIIALVVGWQVVQTLFQASVLVTTGVKVRQLQYDKENLSKTKTDLNRQITQAQRITTFEYTTLASSFQPIDQQVVVNPISTVALR